MASTDRSSASRPPASSRVAGWTGAIAFGVTAAAAAFAVAAGCSYSARDDGTNPGFSDGDANDATDAIVIDVGADTAPPNPLCGAFPPSCPTDDFDPDAGPHTCTPFDAGTDGDVDGTPSPDDTGAETSTDAAIDTAGSGTRSACRVVKIGNTTATACEPAGFGAVDSPCSRDADCSPGLACVGPPTFGRCAPYCCTATPDFDPCHSLVPSRYCTPIALAERPADRVPVCITPDGCTLVSDVGCEKDTTCTVVDTYGDTSCVPSGALVDLACCSTDPADGSQCAAGYACLGPLGNRVCRKLCKIGDTLGCSGSGHCEAQSTFPAGYGICTIDVTDGASDAGHCGP